MSSQKTSFRSTLLTIAVLACISAVAAIGFGNSDKCTKGEGELKRESREVGGFNTINLEMSADIQISQGDARSVEVEAQENLLELIELTTSGQTLTIDTKKNQCFSTKKSMTIYITVPSLEGININGSGDVVAQTDFEVRELAMNINGSGDIVMQGLIAQQVDVIISGSGDVRTSKAGEVEVVEVNILGSGDVDLSHTKALGGTVRIAGSGDVSVWAEQDLTAHIGGSGDIRYKGSPQVRQTILGSGEIHGKGKVVK